MKDKSQLNEVEMERYTKMVKEYDSSFRWNYLEVFARNFKYREPLIINLDKPEIQDYPGEPLFCYTMFAKPGKFQYVISSPEKELIQYQLLCHMRDEELPETRYNDALKSN